VKTVEQRIDTMKPVAMAWLDDWMRNEHGGVALDAVALSAAVFGAALVAMGRVDIGARAQSQPAAALMPHSDVPVQMLPAARTEVQAALQAMQDAELSLAYARIHATFRAQLGQADLSVARALVDYAQLAAIELARRNVSLPVGSESPSEMRRLYDLVL
jgi:hypothetical protein